MRENKYYKSNVKPNGKPRCFISGKISDNENYMYDFENAEKELEKAGFSVVNPARVCAELPKDTTKYVDYIKICKAMLETCDCIYMISGWKESFGARFENHYAENSGMTVYFDEDIATINEMLHE